MGDTNIEWADVVWNPLRGCSLKSAGCTNCYAMRVAHRFSGPGGTYEGLTRMTGHGPVWTGDVRLVPELLDQPLRWRKPRRVFVNSMSDLFHERVPDEYIAAVFGVMAACPQHVFQVLTKRAERASAWFRWAEEFRWPGGGGVGAHAAMQHALSTSDADLPESWDVDEGAPLGLEWPLPNVHLGVSVEDQPTADERIPFLLDCPAAVRWVSYEPALGPVDFSPWLAHHPLDVAEANRRSAVPGRCGAPDRGEAGRLGVEGGPASEEQVGRDDLDSSGDSPPDRRSGGAGLPHRQDDDRREADMYSGPPPRVAGIDRPDSRRTDDQSQERGQVRQRSEQPGTRDILRAADSCDPCPEGGKRSARDAQRDGEVDGGASGRGQASASGRGEADTHRTGIRGRDADGLEDRAGPPPLSWLVIGGESGPGARPFDVAWARQTIEQCRAAGVPVFCKQLGANVRDRNDVGFDGQEDDAWDMNGDFDRVEDNPNGFREEYQGAQVRVRLLDKKGGNPAEWPEDLRVREYPEPRP